MLQNKAGVRKLLKPFDMCILASTSGSKLDFLKDEEI